MTIERNIAVDMVAECLAHYRKFHRKIKCIILSPRFWRILEKRIKDVDPSFEFKNEIQFNNILIKKGSVFQLKNLIPELEPLSIVN